jgi:lipid A ethanolaminephosphotransferase
VKTIKTHYYPGIPYGVKQGGKGLPGKRKLFFISVEMLVLAASVFFSIFCNHLFWQAIWHDRSVFTLHTWLFAGAVFVVLTAFHALLLSLVAGRRTIKPILCILLLVNAFIVYYMNTYTVFFDVSMMRNILHTDAREAHELLSWDSVPYLFFYGLLPVMMLNRVSVVAKPWRKAIWVRCAFMLGVVAVAAICSMLVFQDLSSLMRNHKEVRYLATPGNYLVSTVRALANEGKISPKGRIPVGTDARLAAYHTSLPKPTLLVVVVGETARAANWGLNGYDRQTTPRLAASSVTNFKEVTSCGSNTEVSVPCMFSPFGRKDYDEDKIKGHESLLHVLNHAGVKTIWRDNQSGCKGVCDGLEQERPDSQPNPVLCDSQRCYDEILLEHLDAKLEENRNRNLVIVMHQLGNHGPSYSHRYPERFRQFTPTCEQADLGKCSREEIVNSYDNALLYTDYFLSKTIEQLKAQNTHHAAMIYVSDHGESLGESGIYLHGLPYAIAPKEQTRVPMVMWLSDQLASDIRVSLSCLRQHASRPVSHDYLFHSVLGLMGVETKIYNKAFDITSDCRSV